MGLYERLKFAAENSGTSAGARATGGKCTFLFQCIITGNGNLHSGQ